MLIEILKNVFCRQLFKFTFRAINEPMERCGLFNIFEYKNESSELRRNKYIVLFHFTQQNTKGYINKNNSTGYITLFFFNLISITE